MNKIPASDELLRRLLAADDAAAELPGEHPDDETLALFVEGGLAGDERTRLVAHLAACPQCRRVVAVALTMAGESAEVEPRLPAQPRWFASRPVLAVAASLLMALGVTWLLVLGHSARMSEPEVYNDVAQLLTDRQFTHARQKLAAAADGGVTSPRLRSLQAEAAREIPATIALTQAGSLTDFGYSYDGAVPRGPSDEMKYGLKEANDLLTGIKEDDLDVLLNRGHLRLTQGEPKLAAADFMAATKAAGNRPEPWLGLGLARFMLDEFMAAEAAFRECLERNPKELAARINLAMTLEEENQIPAALSVWQGILATGQLEEQRRKEIERHVAELNQTKSN